MSITIQRPDAYKIDVGDLSKLSHQSLTELAAMAWNLHAAASDEIEARKGQPDARYPKRFNKRDAWHIYAAAHKGES